ncbi:MAG: zinc ribbon domain-containing protein [Candidatus Aenigmatarchaeota archaeon]
MKKKQEKKGEGKYQAASQMSLDPEGWRPDRPHGVYPTQKAAYTFDDKDEEYSCKGCGKILKEDWKTCPYCGLDSLDEEDKL